MQDTRENFGILSGTGNVGQDEFVRFYTAHGYRLISKSTKAEYDLHFKDPQGRSLYVEVKTDCTTYPNLPIETECRGKASGIRVTTAQHFCFYFSQLGELWILDTARLRAFMQRTALRNSPARVFSDTNTQVTLLPKAAALREGLGLRRRWVKRPEVTGTRGLKEPAQRSAPQADAALPRVILNHSTAPLRGLWPAPVR